MSRYITRTAVMLAAVAGIAFGVGFAAADAGRATPEAKIVYRTPSSCIRALDQASEGFSRAVDVLDAGLDSTVLDSFVEWVDATTPGVRADSTNCREMAR